MRITIVFLISLFQVFAVSAQQPGSEAFTTESEDHVQQAILDAGTSLLKSGKIQEAINDHYNKVIAFFEKRASKSNARIYAARSANESLQYLLQAAADNSKQSAIVVKPTYAYAYFLRGYALAELNQNVEAKAAIERAVQLSPYNAQFLAELGNQHIRAKNWKASLDTFQRAETAANDFTPEEAKQFELGKALRGQGYVLVELNRLSEAETAYNKALTLNPNDRVATAELRYVQSLKTKQGQK
jgi:tetratricopeptide (TPR) repeat protein